MEGDYDVSRGLRVTRNRVSSCGGLTLYKGWGRGTAWWVAWPSAVGGFVVGVAVPLMGTIRVDFNP